MENREELLNIAREYPRLEYMIMELTLFTEPTLQAFFDQPFANIEFSIYKVNIGIIGAIMKRAAPHFKESILNQLTIELDRKDYKIMLVRLLKYLKDLKLGVET